MEVRKHNWILHMIDHFTKYSWLYPLKNKEAEDVLECLSQFCWQFGFPQKIHTDNGREFKNSLMSQCCKNGIAQLHGAPRKPSTQGLVERNNQTVKQNIRNLLKEKKQSPNHWCQVLGEAAYKKNIVEHEATKQTPYELVFGIPPWKETKTTPDKKNDQHSTMEEEYELGCGCRTCT